MSWMRSDKVRVGPTVHSLILNPLVHSPDSYDQKRWIEFTSRGVIIQLRVRSDGLFLVRQIIPDHQPTIWVRWMADLEDLTSPAKLIPAERLPS